MAKTAPWKLISGQPLVSYWLFPINLHVKVSCLVQHPHPPLTTPTHVLCSIMRSLSRSEPLAVTSDRPPITFEGRRGVWQRENCSQLGKTGAANEIILAEEHLGKSDNQIIQSYPSHVQMYHPFHKHFRQNFDILLRALILVPFFPPILWPSCGFLFGILKDVAYFKPDAVDAPPPPWPWVLSVGSDGKWVLIDPFSVQSGYK